MVRKSKNVIPPEVMAAIKESVIAALSNVQTSKPVEQPAVEVAKPNEFWFAKITASENGDLVYDFRVSDVDTKEPGEIIGPYPSFTQMRMACIERCKQFLKSAHDLRKTKIG